MGIKAPQYEQIRGYTPRIRWLDPASRLWVGWWGAFLLLNNVTACLVLGISDMFDVAGETNIPAYVFIIISIGYGIFGVFLVIPTVMSLSIVFLNVAMPILVWTSKYPRFRTNLSPRLQDKIDRVKLDYKSIDNSERNTHNLFRRAIIAISILWVAPSAGFLNILATMMILGRFDTEFFVIARTDNFAEWVNLGGIPIFIAVGVYLVLFHALLIASGTFLLNPSNATLLRRVLYLFVPLLAILVPFAMFLTPLANEYLFNGEIFVIPVVWLVFLPAYLLIAVVLPYLYSQRARLSALGGRVKRNIRFLAVGGVAMQLFFMVYWAVLTAPEAGVFYIASVVFAVFLALAWAVVLLLVGERTKRDWGLFALIVAVQVASVVVTAPGVVSA